MRIARIIGNVTLGSRLDGFPTGRLLLAEALDGGALEALPTQRARQSPMPESLVIYDELGAGVGQLVGFSEGREAAMPFWPDKCPVDAYCAAILDNIQITTR
ncbi:MAG: carbon dioxide concentrating mechanism protein CcmL [Planctomycetes bacterium]|jgi:ethanolamine utilization protein EutN|nr:carbon dioxide concentrating mechanism protein CcmL [Planctomycetota bacterium]